MTDDLEIDNIDGTEIKDSMIHGRGLFATQTIAAGTVLCLLDGQRVPFNVYVKNERAFEWNALEGDVLIVRPYRTKYGFINHSRTPNTCVAYNPLRVESLAVIHENQEITLDYRKEPLPKKYLQGHGKSYL